MSLDAGKNLGPYEILLVMELLDGETLQQRLELNANMDGGPPRVHVVINGFDALNRLVAIP